MPVAKRKPPQMAFAEKAPAFEADPATAVRAAQFKTAVKAALVRKFGDLEAAARAADRAFGPEGRFTSGELMRACFADSAERNHWRGEWVSLVMDDAEVRAFFAEPIVDPAEELREMREFFARRAPDALDGYDRKAGRIA